MVEVIQVVLVAFQLGFEPAVILDPTFNIQHFQLSTQHVDPTFNIRYIFEKFIQITTLW